MQNSVTLNNGVKMPVIGLGTHTLSGRVLYRTIKTAYGLGYRNFDTAWLYNNETSLKWALRLAGIKRDNIFITSKLEWKQYVTEASVEKCFKGTLRRLGTDYIDLYLVHWPKPEMYLDMWAGIVELYKKGYVRAIGVSSFLPEHIETLHKVSDIIPAVNQVELHPLNNRMELVEYCKSRGIQVEAHSPFARGAAASELMKNELLLKIADKYNKSAAQIILRWIVQQGLVTIPRSVHEFKLRQNIQVLDFNLAEEDMSAIDSLNANKFFGGDPRRTLPFI